MIFKELQNFSEESPFYPPPSDFSIPKEEFSKKTEKIKYKKLKQQKRKLKMPNEETQSYEISTNSRRKLTEKIDRYFVLI